MAHSLPKPDVTKKPIHSDSDPTQVSNAVSRDIPAHPHMNYSRLPKLHLPTLDGNPLQWQTVWDSFSAANPYTEI